jgi:hypothetical protein
MAVEITQVSSQGLNSTTEYNSQVVTLIPTSNINKEFTSDSYIELFIYDPNKTLLSLEYNFSQYTVLNNGQSSGNNNSISQINIDLEKVLINNGFSQGTYITSFNFFDKKIGSYLENLYISEISSDRTELRIDSTDLPFLDLVEKTNAFIKEREESNYFVDFYLNFGENNLILANNIELDDQDINNPTILIKLYEPLPDTIELNSTLWVVTTIEDPISYQIAFPIEPIIFNDTVKIGGPNFNLDLKDQVNNSTLALSYSDLVLTTLTSSRNQINSLLEEKEIDINVDYTSFSNFIHFSSAKTRLENFYYKVELLEDYSASIAVLDSTINSPNNVSSSKAIYEAKITDIITNFDGYDYYLYYSSGSFAYPKSTTEPPYQLYSSTDPIVLTWLGSSDENSIYYGGLLLSASQYDLSNPDNLFFAIPEYLRNDPSNDNYQLFIDMVGQHYDNIWIYYKDVTNKYDADNRLEYGISKDIVADAIRDFGVKLYQNNFSNEDLYTAFLGLTPDGGLFPFPNITGSLPTPSGYEYINVFTSASNDYLPLDDVNKSLYKRIYHNIPYLLKSKGTLPGLRALITSYGIPDTVLRINEFGGKDKVNSNDWDNWQDEFNYSFNTKNKNFLYTDWEVNKDWASLNDVPNSLMFRFKPSGFPSNFSYSQSIWYVDDKSYLTLTYTGSLLSSGSYSGSIVDPYYQYANLTLYPDFTNSPLSSASILLPFFDGNWWSVMINRHNLGGGTSSFELVTSNKIYEGGDNNTILGFYSASSITSSDNSWTNSTLSSLGRPVSFNSINYKNFEGYFQELRYYTIPISESVFKDYVMNPYSIEGNSINSSPNELIFRAPLGGELYTGSISIHPKVTGSWAITNSFPSDSNFYFSTIPLFNPNTEYFFSDQPVAGVRNIINDKIRLENNVIPEGDTLSPFMSLSQMANVSQSYTQNINYLEVAFSPQNEINEDIVNQIGYFNIGDYIGDPRLRSSSAESYPALDTLRNEYFEKYTKNYNLTDFIRLIKFFDNSLFKMIKDFVPARTSLASGVVIKQHLLERNKYPQPQVEWEDLDISGTLKPQWNDYQPGTVEHFDGGAGGMVNQFNFLSNISQSWYESYPTVSGSVLVLHDNQDEFYNGEYSGSNLVVTTQVLNQSYPLDVQDSYYKQVHYYGITSSLEDVTFKDNFLNNVTSPQNGEILFYNYPVRIFGFGPPTPPYNVWITQYLKIAKIDCSGSNNTTVLGDITQVVIYNSVLGTYVPYYVTVLNENPNYYLYTLNKSQTYISSFWPNQVFNYTVSSSVTASYNVGNGSPKTVINWNSTLAGTNLPHYGTSYFNTSSGILTFENTPNTLLTLSASITSSGTFGIGTSYPISLIQNRNNIETVISSQYYNTLGTTNILLTASLYPIQNDQYYIKLEKPLSGGAINITSAQLLLTQSRAVSASNCEPVIFEPYITTPNFYNSDENALLNNVELTRLSTTYQDVDYSAGITEPVNFDLLISGSAKKAAVQDSNYTLNRHIIPRYLGSKSTSQFLNKWTEGDIGTFGKTPTAESLKTMVAYCDWIGGWPPERMNASALHVKYLINQNGDVFIPNTSENSLANVQGTFQSGERFRINSNTVGSGNAIEYRNVIRGGSRIEPILYTQSGSAPNAQWNTTMSFEDIVPSDQGAVGNYTALYSSPSTPPFTPPAQSWTKVPLTQTTYGTPVSNNEYTVVANTITDGVNLSVQTKYTINIPGSSGFPAYGRIVKQRGVNKVYYPDQGGVGQLYGAGGFSFNGQGIDFIEIPTSDLEVGDTIYVEIYAEGSNLNLKNPRLWVSQYPLYTQPITSSGVNSIWQFPNSGSYPYIITSSNYTLVELYKSNVKQTSITGSGFNPIVLPWSIEYGDEFRFEGREDFSYQVGTIYGPEEGSGSRIFPESVSGSIEVHFNRNLPVSASSNAFNLDHFLIRRYVDDASQILFEGFAPINSTGPYIITPEYVVPELNKNVDTYITDLTQKGLL